MASIIKYDTLVLTDEIYDFAVSNPNRIPLAAVSKRHGALVTDLPTVAERSINMKGTLYGKEYDVTDPEAGARARKDTIANALRLFNKRLYIDSETRFINAYPNAFNWAYRPGSAGKVIDFQINFICPDPFWYSGDDVVTQTVSLLNSDPAESGISGSKIKNAVITNNGDAFAYLKVTVTPRAGTASLSRCRVVNQTLPVDAGFPYRDWIYTGFVIAPDTLTVDSNAFTVKNTSIVIGNFDDLEHWTGIWLWLEPGANTIQVAGTPEADYEFEWRERFY